MNQKFKIILLFISLFSTFRAFSLVDYTETEERVQPKNNSKTDLKNAMDAKSGLIWKSDLSFNADYEVSEYQTKKVSSVGINTHLQTPFNVYIDASYWSAENSGSKTGNPKVLLGFNWLRFGSASDEARFNIYGGARLKGSSDMASSRNDKIFGAETTKRFGSFGLGIGYEVSMSGAPQKSEDMSIGNIQRIALSGGWMISNDIQFELEVENFKIARSDNVTRSSYLSSDVSLSTLSPKLTLTIFPSVNVELGARFRTNRPVSNDDLSKAKLFDIHGLYSNSLFAGLGINI